MKITYGGNTTHRKAKKLPKGSEEHLGKQLFLLHFIGEWGRSAS